MMEDLKVPMNRIGALIGPKGSVKREIERKGNVSIEIDSDDGNVLIEDNADSDQVLSMKARDVVKAIARGFSPEKAMKLLDEEDVFLDIIELKDFVPKSDKAMEVKRGRVIGSEGSAREEIEQKTGAMISIQGKTISLIGSAEQIDKAKRAVEMLLSGARHSTVFRFVGKQEHKKFEL